MVIPVSGFSLIAAPFLFFSPLTVCEFLGGHGLGVGSSLPRGVVTSPPFFILFASLAQHLLRVLVGGLQCTYEGVVVVRSSDPLLVSVSCGVDNGRLHTTHNSAVGGYPACCMKRRAAGARRDTVPRTWSLVYIFLRSAQAWCVGRERVQWTAR